MQHIRLTGVSQQNTLPAQDIEWYALLPKINRHIAQIPQCTSPTPHDVTFYNKYELIPVKRVRCGIFVFWNLWARFIWWPLSYTLCQSNNTRKRLLNELRVKVFETTLSLKRGKCRLKSHGPRIGHKHIDKKGISFMDQLLKRHWPTTDLLNSLPYFLIPNRYNTHGI